MKLSEAKIIIFISQAEKHLRFSRFISSSLSIDYGYLLKQLANMTQKGWLTKYAISNRCYYSVNQHTPLDIARKLLADEKLKGSEIESQIADIKPEQDS